MTEQETAQVAYVTDVEGQWDRLAGSIARTPGLRLDGTSLELSRGVTFVFGGDALDRGPAGRRIVRTLLDAKRRYGARVVLLAGNRDLNKLRLVRELDGHPPSRAPAEARSSRAALLRFIFAQTMGAAGAFDHRATELTTEGLPAGEDAVVESFLADLAPEGAITRYLRECQLAYRHEETLFVHGGLTSQSLGHVPGEARVPGVDAWIDRLNGFCRAQLEAFAGRTSRELADPPWGPLVKYQAPLPGQSSNPASVVYGRLSDEFNNPMLPTPEVIRDLAGAGIRRLVLGHTPSGDTPSVLRAGGFELVIADNSRARVSTGASVVLQGGDLRVRGRVALDDGEEAELACTLRLAEPAGPLGQRTRDPRSLVKGYLPDGRALLFRGLPGYRVEQVATTREALAMRALEEPWGE